MEEDLIEAYALENAINHSGKATQGPVINALFNEGLKKQDIKKTIPLIIKTLKKVNSLSLEEQSKRFEKLKNKIKKREKRIGLPELPNISDKMTFRFAPFPSGPLHIGNTRQLILNDEYAKKYNGKLLLVIDDTIGSEKKPVNPEAYDLIKEGIDWLGAKYDKKIIYKSDRLKIYYDYAEELLKKGYMYVCDCAQEEMQKLRKKGVECPCRNLPLEKHLERWKKMFDAKPGEFTVRLKTNMSHPDPAFRDRVMFRISDRIHPKTKNKYRVWPLLEFSWAIDDHLLGITHIIRGIDLVTETNVEKFIWDIFKWEHPTTIHTGFFTIEGIKISKSKGAQEVGSGQYIGWNDPRLWSLQSLKDRGILPEAIREFCLNMGLTRSNSVIAIEVLYAINKKYLEKAPRYFFIPEPTKIHIKGTPKLKAIIPLHPSEKIGERTYETEQEFYIPQEDFDLIEDKNYRLMHLLNFKSEEFLKTKPRDFTFISEAPDKELSVKMIQWLSVNAENVKVKVRMPDNSIIEGLGEPELLKLKQGEQIQFERFGFVKLHSSNKKKKEMEFWFSHR